MNQFPFIAILGRQPELGLLELESRLGPAALEPFGRQAVRLAMAPPIDELGGVIKLAEVLYDGPAADIRPVPVDPAVLPVADEGKTPFAVSVYGIRATPRFVMAAGLALKKVLGERGSLRLVPPGEGLTVSAAQLRHNRVLERGFELIVVVAGQRMVVARTVGVQNIDAYAKRDHGRPARSAKVGMLPPKLAQVLVNTTSAPIVVDPFCGTGVVLQEALLAGRSVIGSDLAPDMVQASRVNLTWLAEETPRSLGSWSVLEVDARVARLPVEPCAIVSEGYLGPNLTTAPPPARLKEIRAELRALYVAALTHWAAQLPPGAELALCAPAWRTAKGWQYLGVVDDLPRLGYTMKVFKHVPAPVLYARPDQVVGRQLLLLRKR
ncbi:MAG TPA: hypothetical protein VLI05_02250 [Candidatus Saccharimonadia bacterium]|nr:hypothetical protein [Candidatus Saccharimonadia bacterium]